MKEELSKKSTLISVLVNLFLTISQIVTGYIAHSQALIADGIHSLSDLIADFVVLLAIHHGKKGPDEDHHYGHQRYENAASLFLGILLLIVSVGMVYSSVQKLSDPSGVQSVGKIALWVAIISLISKECLFQYMIRIAKKLNSQMLIANAWHARSDAASSLVVAIGIAGNLLGYVLLDTIAALVVGLMIFKMGWDFTWEALHDLMDKSASKEEMDGISKEILSIPGILGFHDLKSRKHGDKYFIDVHLEVNGKMTVEESHSLAKEAKTLIMKNHPVLYVMTHVDPYKGTK